MFWLRTALQLSLLGALLTTTAHAAPAAAEPLAAQRLDLLQKLAQRRWAELGNPVTRWDHRPPVYAPADDPHRLLVVLVDFPDVRFERFAGEPDQGARLAAHYQHTLFDETYTRPDTLSHYYLRQSLGSYHLQGTVLPPVTLSKPRADYGRSYRPEGGDWRNDRDPQSLVEEALTLAAQAHPTLDWAQFDRWDPTDWDGDGLLNEPDGYLDHFVIVFAGNGQSSCHGLYQLQRKITPNAGPGVLDTLSPEELECVDRLWPHRFLIQRRAGAGPLVEGRHNRRGGAPIAVDAGQAPLWARDYNMQSEYTGVSTFIHEFGHSIGLPDLYARTSNNSTGAWEAMSHTNSPRVQNLSAWSRMMLGWLRPAVILPPEAGGKKQQSVYLRRLDAPLNDAQTALAHQKAGLWRAALVALPPKTREIQLAAPPQGRFGLYSGLGNDLSHTATLSLDLSGHPKGTPITLSFDAWHDIEGGWDFAYVEASTHQPARGEQPDWRRLTPTDRALMPAKHGHDGHDTRPGFTGLSGDRDGDGKNEQQAGCDPSKPLAHGEDKASAAKNPCLTPSWVRAEFELSAYAGGPVQVRWQYFTDMAAVGPGLFIDDVQVRAGSAEVGAGAAKEGAEAARSAQGGAEVGAGVAQEGGAVIFADDFEGERRASAWQLDGFVRSPGAHTLLVPHYYLLEYRDPYADADSYDAGLGQSNGLRVFWDLHEGRMRALRVRPRPGVLAWYFDGAYNWSENDPASNGPGKGSLLAVDAWPEELAIPGLAPFARGTLGQFNTHYDLRGAEHQPTLRDAFRHTHCFVRNAAYRPKDLSEAQLGGVCPSPEAGAQTLRFEGRPLLYGYEKINAHLPGPERDQFYEMSELYDYVPPLAAQGERPARPPIWRLRDRSLRFLHTYDAPFALEPFEGGVEIFDLVEGEWRVSERLPHPAVRRFDDANPARWLNPKLPFGGLAVPDEGFSFELAKPKPDAPEPAEVKVYFNWR